MTDDLTIAYADPPYMGQCGSYGHFHNDGGPMPWDGECWDDSTTQERLLVWLKDNCDGWAFSCNPTDLERFSRYGRVGAWTKTWHQIRPTTVQFAWEPVIFRLSRSDNTRNPMVRDWLSCPTARETGQRGAKPDLFNDWILDLTVYEPGDDFTDLFPGSGGMQRALDRRLQRLELAHD